MLNWKSVFAESTSRAQLAQKVELVVLLFVLSYRGDSSKKPFFKFIFCLFYVEAFRKSTIFLFYYKDFTVN